jgi:hypothetical protein
MITSPNLSRDWPRDSSRRGEVVRWYGAAELGVNVPGKWRAASLASGLAGREGAVKALDTASDGLYVALIYVDVVEFEGSHIRKFYADMAQRFQTFLERNKEHLNLERLRPGVSPLAAVMLASRFLLHYFSVEVVFGVPNHFGTDTDTVLKQIADIFEHGMLRAEEPKTQDTERRTQNTGHRTQDTEHRTQDTEHRTQDTGHRTQNAGRRRWAAGR